MIMNASSLQSIVLKVFSYAFDMPIYSVLSTNVADEYVFMMEGTTDEVKLR